MNRLTERKENGVINVRYATEHETAIHRLAAIEDILDNESGTSLRAAGWRCVGQAGGLRWTGKRRPTVDLYPAQLKIRSICNDLRQAQCSTNLSGSAKVVQ